jgi:hypothetical protein
VTDVPAHLQKVNHSYIISYPEHPARADDPHYKDFEEIRRRLSSDPSTWQCAIGLHRNDFSECDLTKPLELHHSHIEFALQNGVDLAWLEKDYPGISNPNELGAWIENPQNLLVLCIRHHISAEGIHVLSSSDYEAAKYVKGLIG